MITIFNISHVILAVMAHLPETHWTVLLSLPAGAQCIEAADGSEDACGNSDAARISISRVEAQGADPDVSPSSLSPMKTLNVKSPLRAS